MTTTTRPATALERAILVDAFAIDARLAALRERPLGAEEQRLVRPGLLPQTWPTRTQLARAVLRTLRRLVDEPNAFGLSQDAPRQNVRARLLRYRALRLPFLLRAGSVVPGDLSGLRSSADVIITHLLGTHHDVQRGVMQARYDLELLALHEGGLAKLRHDCAAVVDGTHPQASLYRDLCVYDGYHEGLLALVDDVRARGFDDCDDIDLSAFAMLRACAALPDEPITLAALPRVWRTAATSSATAAAAPPVSTHNDTLDTLAALTPSALAALFDSGEPVAATDLAGQRFLGRSLGLPRVVERLTWRTFRKDTAALDDDRRAAGVNVRVPQPWQNPTRGERAVMPFVVHEPSTEDDGAVIDYRATHPAWHPLGYAVDPLRRLKDGTILGVTELCVFGRRVRTPTWFALTAQAGGGGDSDAMAS